MTDAAQDDAPAGTEPGAPSQPTDTTGGGPVTLGDRTEPGGQGSPDTNQAKAEPIAEAAPEPEEPPELSSMNVGAGDPQAPSHDAAAALPTAPSSPEPTVGLPGGTSHKAPGLQGTTPAGEAVESDVAAGARRMDPQLAEPLAAVSADGGNEGQGDPAPSPAAGDGAAPGTSEEQGIARGSRLPQE
ncbi:MAG: hypothetical protein KY451_02355 [Actinobacteria bacterium]|nr:hypothetical protein [Actinomycetota bacterium]MBW3646285.1 hypothetical protein [Actinomycetota bacterium]